MEVAAYGRLDFQYCRFSVQREGYIKVRAGGHLAFGIWSIILFFVFHLFRGRSYAWKGETDTTWERGVLFFSISGFIPWILGILGLNMFPSHTCPILSYPPRTSIFSTELEICMYVCCMYVQYESGI